MMKNLLAIATLSLCTLAVAAPSQAQHTRGSSGSTTAGRAAPRGTAVAPAIVGSRVGPGFVGGYRPYYYPRYSVGFGFYGGYGYGYPYYSPYYYPYGYYGSPYAYEGYPPYGYGGNYAVAPGAGRAQAYGGVRITDAPKDAPVYADGYYVGTVNDFDGAFQHLNLEPGTHHIEVREQGQPPLAIDVNVRPGETITYHAK